MSTFSNKYITLDNFKLFVLVALSALALAIGSHIGTRTFLYTAGISGALLCIWAWITHDKPSVPATLLIPIAFIFYVLVSPGTPFIDARIAGRLACALFAGIAAQFFFRAYLDKVFLSLNMVLSLSVILGGLYGVFFAPELISDRLALNFGNPHLLAFTAATAIFITLVYSATLTKKLRTISHITVLIALVAIVLTISRSTYVGLTFAGGAYILRYHTKEFLKATCIVVVLCAMLYPLLPAHQQSRIETALTAPLKDTTVRQRLGIWYTTIAGIKESPILGHGLRSYTKYDQQYKQTHFDEMSKIPHAKIEKTRWAHPHNLYLASLFGWGILGTLLFIAAFIPALRQAKGRSKKFLILMVLFNLGYGLTELRIKRDDGAFFLFFPLGMAYGSVLLEYYRSKHITISANTDLLAAFKRKRQPSPTC